MLPFLFSCAAKPSKTPNILKPADVTTAPSNITQSLDGTGTVIIENISEPDSRSYAVYGNWCGPNHPRDINNALDPVDRLDAACMNHDICYAKKGYLDCDCDQTLNTEIKQDLNSGVYTLDQILVARNIHRYFSASPCDGSGNGKIAPSRAAHKIYNRVKNKVTNILDRVLPD